MTLSDDCQERFILVSNAEDDPFETDPLRSTLLNPLEIAFNLLIFKTVHSQ